MKRDKVLLALAGQPNTGKSTVFNALTGASQHVANYPGVTVEKMTGFYRYDGAKVEVVDLPGTYSLTSYSPEERVSRDFLLHESPSVVVNVANASNLKRHLYLTFQLLEMQVPPCAEYGHPPRVLCCQPERKERQTAKDRSHELAQAHHLEKLDQLRPMKRRPSRSEAWAIMSFALFLSHTTRLRRIFTFSRSQKWCSTSPVSPATGPNQLGCRPKSFLWISPTHCGLAACSEGS